jgi:hypothetical protein
VLQIYERIKRFFADLSGTSLESESSNTRRLAFGKGKKGTLNPV